MKEQVKSSNGVVLKLHDRVMYGIDRCAVIDINGPGNLHLENVTSGVSWDLCEAKHCRFVYRPKK